MSQHDYVIDNQSAPAARSDINAVLQAIATTNSGASAPVNSFPNQLWFDTAANQLKKRNEAGTGWIVLGTVDDTGGTFTPNSLLTTAGIAPATLVTNSEGIGNNNNNTTIPTCAAVVSYASSALSIVAPATAGDNFNLKVLWGALTPNSPPQVTSYESWFDPVACPIRCDAVNYGTVRLRFDHTVSGSVSYAWARVVVEGTVVAEWIDVGGPKVVARVVDFAIQPGYRIVVQTHKDPAYPTTGGSSVSNVIVRSGNATIGVA